MSLVARADERTYEDWHAWRQQGIGGSDAGVICGLSPWKGALTVWLEKTGRLKPEPRAQEAEWLRWGRRLEAAMTAEFEEVRGLYVAFAGSLHERAQSPWQRTTLDGLVYESALEAEAVLPDLTDPQAAIAVLELKTSSHRSPLSWEEGPPKLYRVQVQHELMVTGLPVAYLGVLHDGSRFRVHEIERDEDAIDILQEIEAEFWACVQEDRPPPVDSRRSTEVALRSAFPADPGARVVLAEDALARARAYAPLQEEREALEAELAQQRMELMLAMGEAEAGVDEAGRVVLTWKAYESERVDLDGLRQNYPAIVQEYTRRTSTRRFAIKAQEMTRERSSDQEP